MQSRFAFVFSDLCPLTSNTVIVSLTNVSHLDCLAERPDCHGCRPTEHEVVLLADRTECRRCLGYLRPSENEACIRIPNLLFVRIGMRSRSVETNSLGFLIDFTNAGSILSTKTWDIFSIFSPVEAVYGAGQRNGVPEHLRPETT